jgi:hypothetical protein
VAVPRGSTSAYANRGGVSPRSTAPAYANRDVAVPRGSGATFANRAATPAVTSPIAPQGASPSREFAVPRTGATPRYVNRGDEIIRSQTARPLGPAPSAPPESRTVPSGPARRADEAPAFERVGQPRYDRQPRVYATPRASSPAPAVGGQPVHPDFQPRTAMPRTDVPMDRRGGEAAPVHPDYRPRYEAPARGPEYARPRGESAAPAPAPARGGGRVEGRPSTAAQGAPSRVEGRQAPPSQAAPSGGGERAVPRRGGRMTNDE